MGVFYLLTPISVPSPFTHFCSSSHFGFLQGIINTRICALYVYETVFQPYVYCFTSRARIMMNDLRTMPTLLSNLCFIRYVCKFTLSAVSVCWLYVNLPPYYTYTGLTYIKLDRTNNSTYFEYFKLYTFIPIYFKKRFFDITNLFIFSVAFTGKWKITACYVNAAYRIRLHVQVIGYCRTVSDSFNLNGVFMVIRRRFLIRIV